MSNSPIEPRHDIRQAAMGMFEIYTAYVEAGFNESQAMQLVAHIITAGNEGTA